jgi:hypothetical protein
MPKIPPYISIIFMSSHVRVSHSTKAIREAIMAAGYEIFKDEYSVCNVKINPHVSSEKKIEQLDEILLSLNDLGLLFGEDYKQAMAPADYMRDLQEKSALKKPFRSIGWSGPGDFTIRTFEPKGS